MNNISLRTIKTARTEKEMNIAAKKGFRPLLKPVEPSKDIKVKYAVLQNSKTGEVQVINDFRAAQMGDKNFKVAIDFTFYYPYHFELPFAAYLIPNDIKLDEQVYIEDLIEDIVGVTWNQGDAHRLKGCVATWNGTDFTLSIPEPSSESTVVG